MSIAVMARIWRLDSEGLDGAERHGRREDQSSRSRLVRDADPVTWSSDPTVDPLSLRELYERHVAGAFRPSGKAIALHMLVKLPSSVAVETVEQAKKAMSLAVEFAQESFGGNAVFAARMDRDEKSLTNVDLFLAPRYIKETKLGSRDAISTSRHLKILAKKYDVGPRATDCWDSPKDRNKDQPTLREQGSALQDAFADFFLERGYDAKRGDPKQTPGPDWQSPEVWGAKKDREVAHALTQEADEKLETATQLVAEANQRLKAAQELQRASAVEMGAAEQLRRDAKIDASRARADRLSAEALNDEARGERKYAEHQTEIATAARADATSKLALVDIQQKLLAIDRGAVRIERSDAEKAKIEAREVAREAEEAKRKAAELLATNEVRERALAEGQEALRRSTEQANERDRDILKREKAVDNQKSELIKERAALDVEIEDVRSRLSAIEKQEAATVAALESAKQEEKEVMAMGHGVAAWMRGDIVGVRENDRGGKTPLYKDAATEDRIGPIIKAVQQSVVQFVVNASNGLRSLISDQDIEKATFKIAQARVSPQMIDDIIKKRVSVANAAASAMIAPKTVAESPQSNQIFHAYNQSKGNMR